MSARDKRAEKAQLGILWDVPFFASGCMRLPIVWDESVQTACTDGKCIKWNPKFFDSCTDQQLVTVMCEEVGHCQLGHLWRHPAEAKLSPEAWSHWNYCVDQEVRWMMRDWSEITEKQKRFDPFPFPEPREGFLPQDKFRGMCAEAVWRATWPLPQGGGGNKGKQAKGGSAGKGTQGKGNPGDSPGSMGDIQLPKDGGADAKADADKLKGEWEADACRSAKQCQGRGELPASIARLVDGILSPKVPWWELLRQFLREQAADDWDMMKPDIALSDGTGFIMPSLNSERVGPVVFATDTSASIDHEQLRRFQSEKQHCLDEMNPSRLMDIYCDAKVHAVREYTPGDKISTDAPGGGGTDFAPVFTELEKRGLRPKCLVYLTDMDGSHTDTAPDFPVLWVTWAKGKAAPFGQVIEVD